MAIINGLIGDFGKYHLWLCFIIFPNKLGAAFHQMSIIFLAPPPVYYCPNNKSCCDEPVYDKSQYKRTIVMEWNLICGNAWLKDLTQMAFQFGVLSGSLLFGIASDKYGRRPALIVSIVLEVFSGIVTSFLPDFWSFTIVRMFLGASVGGVMVVGFVIVMEYVGKCRDMVAAAYHVPFTVGYMLLALFGYYIRDYVILQLSISLVNIVLLVYICILPESPRWLLAKQKTTAAIQLLEHVAKINNKPVDEIALKVELYQLEHIRQKRGSFIDLFRTPNLRKNILVMSFTWLVCSYCFYGVTYYISHLAGDVYVNVIASGTVIFMSCFIAMPLIKFMKRRTLLVMSHVLSGFCLLTIAVMPVGRISVGFGCLGLLFTQMVFIISYLYCSEMFPTVVHNAAVGICSMMARLGSMLAPFVADFGEFGEWCPPVAFGIMPIIAAALGLLLPETKDCQLMLTIEEGEAFGRNQSSRRTENNASIGIT
ncbi:organic cation transporter-like protein [Plodia interpunctella]|uniref:organic cation transporter-like protein n=1 Tax=Plodia interpunctella TaxID=58824 RepID=UPI002368218C|nr:organic cation transporter-like protein [Plodia interpunctella]